MRVDNVSLVQKEYFGVAASHLNDDGSIKFTPTDDYVGDAVLTLQVFDKIKDANPNARIIVDTKKRDVLSYYEDCTVKVNEADKEAFVAGSKGIYEEFGAKVKGGAELVKRISALR